MNKGRYQILLVILLGLSLLLFFWPTVIEGKAYSLGGVTFSDYLNFQFPNRETYRQALLLNKLPWWVSGIGNGYPLLAEGQTGVFYPPNLIFFRLFSTNQAINWLIFLHLWFAAVGMYFLGYRLTKSHLASALAGIIFSLSGFIIIQLTVINLIMVVSIFPWVFLSFLKLIEKFTRWRFLIMVILVSLQILAGHVPMVYYQFLILLLTGIWINGKNLHKQLILLIVLLVVFMTSFCLSAIQAIPTVELMQRTIREKGVDFNDATMFSYPKEALLSFFYYTFKQIPEYESENNISRIKTAYLYYSYLGLIPLIFLPFGIWVSVKSRKERFLFVIGSVAFLLTLGRSTPIFGWFWNFVPGMNYFRYSIRFLVFLEFFVCLLASLGLANFTRWCIKKKSLFNLKILIYGLTWLIFPITVFDLYIHQKDIQPLKDLSFWLKLPETAKIIMQQNSNYSRVSNLDIPDNIFNLDLTLQYSFRNFLSANYNLLFNIPSNQVLSAGLQIKEQFLISDKSYARDDMLKQEAIYQYKNPKQSNIPVSLPENYIKLLKVQGINFLITPIPIDNLELSLVHKFTFPYEITRESFFAYQGNKGFYLPVKIDSGYLYKIKSSLPRALIIPQEVQTDEKMGQINQLLDSGFNPWLQVLVESAGQSESKDGTILSSNVTINEDLGDRLILKVDSNKKGWLYLSDTYYQGWKAYIDGVETKIYRANYAFRAIKINTPGKHTVEFIYDPISRKIGLGVTISTILVLLIVFYLDKKIDITKKIRKYYEN